MKKALIIVISLFVLAPDIRTQSQNIPAPPFNLKLEKVTRTYIKIVWESKKENVLYFQVERKGCQEEVPSSVNIDEKTEQIYKDEAQRVGGEEKFKKLLQDIGLTDELFRERIRKWVIVEESRKYRKFIKIGEPIKASIFEYLDRDITDLKKEILCEYVYRILACNENGCSEPSNELTVTHKTYYTLSTTVTCSTADQKRYTTNDYYYVKFDNLREMSKYLRLLPSNTFRYLLIPDIDGGKYAEIYITVQSLVKQNLVSGIYLEYMPLDSYRRPLWEEPGHYLAWDCRCRHNDEVLECYPFRYGDKKTIESHTDTLPDETAYITVGISAYDYMIPVK